MRKKIESCRKVGEKEVDCFRIEENDAQMLIFKGGQEFLRIGIKATGHSQLFPARVLQVFLYLA